MSLFVLGSLHLDVIVNAPRLPNLDETLPGQSVRYDFGGKGGNQAVAAARMGATVAMAGAVGSDSFATTLRDRLIQTGVDQQQVTTDPGPSGMSVAIVDAGGNYGAVIVSAANLKLTGQIALPSGCTHLILQNEIPEAANLAAARIASAAGVRVILNAAPARPTGDDLLALTDLLIVNRGEASVLSGLPPDDPATINALLSLGPASVIVTRGGDGLCLGTANGTTDYPARQVTVVSTHGAGDAFIGALAAHLDAGNSLETAAAFAQTAAALHVSTEVDQRDRITAKVVMSHL